jgi:hypothetical protein
MIITILSILLFTVFTSLALIHFYWLFGGKWGLKEAIPTKEDGTPNIKPPKIATLIVGCGLALLGIFYLIKASILTVYVPNWVIGYGSWIIPSIFILRAIGEFKYVGLFKKIKDTTFGKADTKIFVPLCLTIGIIGLIIQFLN